MLNGIGGRTIAEAKETLTAEEFIAWAEYRKAYGTLNASAKLDYTTAFTLYAINRFMGGESNLEDFLPERLKPEATMDDLISMMKAKPRGN